MIEQITIKNFKSFRDVPLKLGSLNIFIGANASGKSNFFDALRVLQGIGYGFTLSEILDGKPKSATSEVWEGIRGGHTQVPFAYEDANIPTSFQVTGRLPNGVCSDFEFTIAFLASGGLLRKERLSVSGEIIYEDETGEWPSLQRDQPWLTVIVRETDERRPEEAERVAHIFADMQRMDPSPTLLRAYSQAFKVKRMGERGENFAALVRMICDDPGTKEAYLSWLRELRPRDVNDIGIKEGAIGEPMLMMKERGHEWPAPALSDGTLRFAAIAAAFFQPDMPSILTIEEIENGIHASRLRLLVELMRSQTAAGKTQVMVTTHSPVVLAWLKPEEYATTFCCKRDEETGESRIVPLSEIPRFQEVVSKQPIGDLFAEGWLEEAL